MKTPSILDLSGPSSAPSIIQWDTCRRQSNPVATSTPVAATRPKMAFDISSIVEDDNPNKKTRPKSIFEEAVKTKTSSGHSIPVGIAVGRQRVTKQEHRNSNVSSQPISSYLSQPSLIIPSPALSLPLQNTGLLPLTSTLPTLMTPSPALSLP